MKVAINTLITPAKKIGAGIYLENLLSYYQKIDTKKKYLVFLSSKEPNIFNSPEGNLKKVFFGARAQPSWKLLFWQPVFIFKLLVEKADLYHIPNTSPLLFKSCPTIISILDLQEFYTNKYGNMRGTYRKIINYIAARVADKIITISYNSKKDIVKLLRIPEEKVVVTYLGINPMFRPLDREKCYSKINTKYGLSGSEYIVSVGELHPGKNFVRLIQAFSKIKNNNAPYKLLIVGKKGWRYQDIYAVVEDLDLKNDVIFTNYVPFEELPVLYNGAALYVYPTLYEGFGLPALEAMACGTPLVTSNVSSLSEVVGDGGIFVDPYNVDSLSEAIAKVLSDNNLRSDLIKKGLLQAKKFTWEKTARQTIKVYEEVYNKAI